MTEQINVKTPANCLSKRRESTGASTNLNTRSTTSQSEKKQQKMKKDGYQHMDIHILDYN